MGNTFTCTLSISVSRPDVHFMMHTIPHLVRMCTYPFSERVLVIDTAPLPPRYHSDSHIATMEQLRDCCARLVADGVVDRLADIDYSEAFRRRAYRKHFGRPLRETSDYRGGGPLLGYVFAIEDARGDYFLHFDSDMLLYQATGYSWIAEALSMIQSHPDLLLLAPRPGPPSLNGRLRQHGAEYVRDPRGFFRFKHVTSRKFLMDRRRFESMLPLKPLHVSWKRRVRALLSDRSTLQHWEHMVTSRMAQTNFVRADLDSLNAWTLHTPDHGPAFVAALPSIIEKVESGWYPPEQGGDYNLQLQRWL
jgi:hypothetical protein